MIPAAIFIAGIAVLAVIRWRPPTQKGRHYE